MRSRQRAHPGIGVAVMYCEWLGRPFPGGGRSARRHLVDPLGAEVLIAGTFLQRDCEGGGGGCFLQRVEGLRPLAATRLDPMLSLDELRQLVSHAPHWPAVLRAFDPALSWRGLTPWSPLLGNANVSILRQLHDCARCLTLLQQTERARGSAFRRVMVSRLEAEWLADFPPLGLMGERYVWTPYLARKNVDDRHALLSRPAADVYLGRLALLLSPNATEALPWKVLVQVTLLRRRRTRLPPLPA